VVDALHVELARLDLGEVQDVIQDRQERLGAGPDGLCKVALLGVEVGLQQEPAHPDDAVHGCPDLVAHVRQELRLQAAARKGLVSGTLELRLGGDAVADVVHEGAVARAVLMRPDRELDREDAPVAGQRGDLDPRADDVGLPAGDVPGEARVVRGTEILRDHELGQPLAQRVLLAPTEQRGRLRVPGRHEPAGVHAHEGVVGRLEDSRQPSLPLA